MQVPLLLSEAALPQTKLCNALDTEVATALNEADLALATLPQPEVTPDEPCFSELVTHDSHQVKNGRGQDSSRMESQESSEPIIVDTQHDEQTEQEVSYTLDFYDVSRGTPQWIASQPSTQPYTKRFATGKNSVLCPTEETGGAQNTHELIDLALVSHGKQLQVDRDETNFQTPANDLDCDVNAQLAAA